MTQSKSPPEISISVRDVRAFPSTQLKWDGKRKDTSNIQRKKMICKSKPPEDETADKS
jgi:hypothetical protein